MYGCVIICGSLKSMPAPRFKLFRKSDFTRKNVTKLTLEVGGKDKATRELVLNMLNKAEKDRNIIAILIRLPKRCSLIIMNILSKLL